MEPPGYRNNAHLRGQPDPRSSVTAEDGPFRRKCCQTTESCLQCYDNK